MDSLTGQQQAILGVEAQFWRTAGAKDEAIRALGLTPVRYYQVLNRLLDDPAALAADPLTVNRARRIRHRGRSR